MTLAAEDANSKLFDVSADVDVVVAGSLKKNCRQLSVIILVGLLSNHDHSVATPYKRL